MAELGYPILGGGCPAGWPLEQWEAFELLHAGASYATTARTVGRAPSTVSKWIRRWRDIWGEDVFESPTDPRSTLTAEGRAKGAAAGGEAKALRHADNRAALALSAGITADHCRAAALAIVDRFMQNPARMAEFGPREVAWLARAYDQFASRADALADVGAPAGLDPTPTADVDLSALEAEAYESETQEILAAADVIVGQFRLMTEAS